MKKECLVLLLSLALLGARAQSVVYHHLDNLIKKQGDTIELPRKLIVEKRAKGQILLTGGADYKITSNRKLLNRSLRSRYYAARVDSALYVNCKRLRINKFRFGGFYAPAMLVNGKLYFAAEPVGPATTALSPKSDYGLGEFGSAISNSAYASKRVFYEIDPDTEEVQFVGKERMLDLLEDHPEWKREYLRENTPEARTTGKFLKRLQEKGGQ